MEGWIKLHRKLTDWEWYHDINVCRLFIHLLITASYEDKRWQGKVIKRGQVVASVNSLADKIDLTPKQVRVALDKLKLTNEVAIERANKYSIITICNYADYQNDENEKGKQEGEQKGNQGANKGQAEGKQRATSKEYKEIKKERNKENKNRYGTFENVLLTAEEFERLKTDYGESSAIGMIEFLSCYIAEKGYKSKSHNLAIRRWVVTAYSERQQRTAATQPQLTTRTEIDEQGNTIAVWPDGTRARLGIGEYINAKGEREYNKQLPSVPRTARPRPGRDYFFNRESNTWTTA